jgi:hypothetical protein
MSLWRTLLGMEVVVEERFGVAQFELGRHVLSVLLSLGFVRPGPAGAGPVGFGAAELRL